MQQWDPKQYAEHARFVSELGMPVVELLSPQPGERILDLGCGDGILTIKLGERGCEVVGVDSSPAMVAAARSLGANAHVIDGHRLPFVGEFDAVFSNAALHWMRHPEEVISSVWRALKPSGRFVGEFVEDSAMFHRLSLLSKPHSPRAALRCRILGFSQGLRNIESFFSLKGLR
jgi:trans-aconitate methyltransferase